jgi:hypothetical protein
LNGEQCWATSLAASEIEAWTKGVNDSMNKEKSGEDNRYSFRQTSKQGDHELRDALPQP